MANRISEADNRPLNAPPGSVQLVSGTAPGMIMHKLLIVYTVTGNLTVETLDGGSITLTGMPVGAYTLDCQFDKVTWTGTATAAGFYRE